MWMQWYVWALLALASGGLAVKLLRARARRPFPKTCARASGAVLTLLALLAFAITAWLVYWRATHPRTPLDEQLFPGIRYIRHVSDSPRPTVAHLLHVDLSQSGLSFVVTQPQPETAPRLRAQTVRQFLQEQNLQLAINANFFHPFHSRSPWDFYPRVGDPVQVLGRAASAGHSYSTQAWADATLYLSSSNRAEIGTLTHPLWNAISGDQFLIRHGKILADPADHQVYPRCAVGLTTNKSTLILALVDGRQPGYSEGSTLHELALLLQQHGAHDAINLDGGGSVTLVIARPNAPPLILNSPIHTRIPGRQRPIANHLGIRATAAVNTHYSVGPP